MGGGGGAGGGGEENDSSYGLSGERVRLAGFLILSRRDKNLDG